LDAEDWIKSIKNMVEDCRKLRGEMNVSPAEKVPLFIIGDKDEVAKFDSYLIASSKA
jgi:valyl-tRNA synthetase